MISSDTADISGSKTFSPRGGLSNRAFGKGQAGCSIILGGSSLEQNGDLRMNSTVLSLRT